MSAQIRADVGRLLNLFHETWAESDAWRTTRMIEASGQTANWEMVLQASRTRAQELFQPALSSLDSSTPVALVLEQLLKRLEKSLK
jgi:hypothetical protein